MTRPRALASNLARFDLDHQDNDGKTMVLEQWIKKGAEFLIFEGDQVREKYRHSIPRDFTENRLSTFVFR